MAIEHSVAQISEDEIKQFWRSVFRYLGDDPDREGLRKTPQRIIKSWGELYAGYKIDPQDIIREAQFQDGCCEEMVIADNIQGFSMCEHHVLPFSFRCSVGYIPDGKLLGASKIPRLVECYSRRLQIQEKMGSQIADALMEGLKPKGVMVVCYGQHLCMLCRGVRQHKSRLITSAIRGVFLEGKVRDEFLSLIAQKE